MESNEFWNPDYLTQAELQELFLFFFSLPLIVYLVAWAYQTVIHFATNDEN